MNTSIEKQTLAEMTGVTAEQAQFIADIGCDLAQSGRLEDSRVIFEGLVTLNPKDASAQAALGTVYQKLGRTLDARKAYDACLALEPQHPVALGSQGELKLLAKDKTGWLDLAKAVEFDPTCETLAARRARALITAVAEKQKQKA